MNEHLMEWLLMGLLVLQVAEVALLFVLLRRKPEPLPRMPSRSSPGTFAEDAEALIRYLQRHERRMERWDDRGLPAGRDA